MEAKLLASKIDPRLQSLITSPYVQQHLQLAGLINHRGQMISYKDYLRSLSRQKRRRREREAITQEIVSRAMRIDQNHRRSRRHQFEIAARRVVNNNFDILSKQYRKQSDSHRKFREKSAPSCLIKEEDDGERRSQVVSIDNRQSKSNKNLLELDQEENRLERGNQLSLPPVERHACEVTMLYRSTTTTKTSNPLRDEIVVMQQHSTGQNLVIYRGFLVKGESFSFKSQRRPTSSLSLAFYAKGFIDSVVNDCCEFRYGRRNQQTNEHSQFCVERVRKASPCEKCRKKYSQRTLAPNVVYTPSNATQNEKVRQHYLTPVSKLPVDDGETVSSQQQNSSSKEHHNTKKATKKYPNGMNTINGNENKGQQVTHEQKSKKISSSKKQSTKERSASIDFSVLESALDHDEKSSTQLNPIESSCISNAREKSTQENTTTIQERTFTSEGDPNKQQWVDQTDIAAWDGSDDSTTAIDPGNILQLFMAQLQQQLQKHQAQSSDVRRHEKSVENFVYILDGNLPISEKEQRKLRGLINFGFTFNDLNDGACLEVINRIVNEQIILILSPTSMKTLDTDIRNASQLRLIYIVDRSKGECTDAEKIRGIYINLTSVCDQLEKDMKLLIDDLMTILSVPANDTSDSTFAYVQVLKDILLENEENNDLKKEMLDFCRQEYADNEIQLRFIDEFEHHFRSEEAVRWYLRQEIFLFKMLTRAFRAPDPDILFKLRFFIQQLHRQLKSNLSPTSMTIYRAQHISKDDFDTIYKTQSGFLAFNQFLLTNKTKIIPKRQTSDLLLNNSECKLVLFQMVIGSTIPRMTVETNSEEVLITTATVFRISDVEQTNDGIPIVKLTSNEDVLKAVQEVTKSVREAARGPFPLLRMAKLMKEMEYIHYTEYFCLILIDDPIAVKNETANLVVGGLFHALCSTYYEQEQYDRALEQLEKSLKVYSRVLPLDDIKLTPTYNNMGSIYHKQGLDEQALQFHKKAYDIQVKSSNPDPESVAAYAGNIASVLIKQDRYEEAIPYLEFDIKIRQRLHPNGDDLNLAVKYHNLAGAQFRINKYAEALENYEKCLDIELRVHPSNHPTVAVTYYNMATALEGLGQLQEAIETIQKARKRLLLTRDENDEEVQMHQEYEKRLQQKLWVKSLFGSD